MTMLEKSQEFDKLELYAMVKGPGTNLKTVLPEQLLDVTAWAFFSDGEGENQRELLAVRTPDGVFRTNSPTFKNSFRCIVSDFYRYPQVRVERGQSKAGREFIDCVLVGGVDER